MKLSHGLECKVKLLLRMYRFGYKIHQNWQPGFAQTHCGSS